MKIAEDEKNFLKGILVGGAGMFFYNKNNASIVPIVQSEERNHRNTKKKKKNTKKKRRNTLGLTVTQGRVGLGMDIGGTLTKIVYFEPTSPINKEEEIKKKTIAAFIKNMKLGETGQIDAHLNVNNIVDGGTMMFFRFATNRMDKLLAQIRGTNLMKMVAPRLTGGGAAAFDKETRGKFQKAKLAKKDELGSLIQGLDYIIKIFPDSCYSLAPGTFKDMNRKNDTLVETKTAFSEKIRYPYLVANIGSGVSIMKVTSRDTHERIGGSALGGGTFFGLCRAMTHCKTFQEALEMCKGGNSDNANLLIRDIYGEGYDECGLSADVPAAYFGKLTRMADVATVDKKDLAKAALIMITNNIGSLANLYAHKVLHVPDIIFMGSFLQNNDISKKLLAHSTDYWSEGKNQALFVKHEGYLGALGSLVEKYYDTETGRLSQ